MNDHESLGLKQGGLIAPKGLGSAPHKPLMRKVNANECERCNGTAPKNFTDGLSNRVRNIFWRMGISTKQEAERAIRKKILHPGNLNAFGFGQKSLNEVRAWLGLKPEMTDNEVRYWRAKFAFEMLSAGSKFREIARTLRLRGAEEARQLSAAFPRLSKIVNRKS